MALITVKMYGALGTGLVLAPERYDPGVEEFEGCKGTVLHAAPRGRTLRPDDETYV